MAKAPGKRAPRKQGKRVGARAKPLSGSGPQGRQQRALADVARVLQSIERPSAIIGGIAVIAWGYARFTADIDCAIAAPLEDLTDLAATFAAAGFEPREDDAIAFARESLVLLLKHKATGVDVDVSLALLAFELEALGAPSCRRAGPPASERGCGPRRTSGRPPASRPKDLQDIEGLLSLGYEVDSGRIATILAAFDEALDTDRKNEWLRLVEKTR